LWDVATGEIVAHLGGHTDLVRAVAWSPDATRLASSGDDTTVRVWDLALPAPTAAYASPSTDQIANAAVDALGIEDDVRGLAAVVAAKSVEPPLSIGLFADWGGGKSFFMKLLKGRIEALERGGHPAFCSGIRPIDFNAWHYRDADLWSSLASHIFETLATDPVTERRVTTVSAVAIDAALREAVGHREETKRKLDLVRHGPATRGSEEIRDAAGQLRRAAQDLGINAAQIERVSERARAAQYAIGLPLLALRRLGRRWRWWLGVCVLVVAGLVLAWLSITVGGTVLRSLSRVSWLSAAVVAGVEAGRSLVAVWHRLGPLLKSLAQARAREAKKLQDELDRTDERISELRDQYGGSVSSRRLLAFIQGRSESPDYRERLGVINLIRRDFEEMAELLGQSAAEPGVAGRRIDRIVLYIDDLDRCGSQRVVEVLEAVHLILSIDLFVVVLAVDPRWLVKSLELHYSELLSAVTEDEDITAESHWAATPVNYLEKILQVPYTLRPMTETGYATLMSSLLNPLPAPDPSTSAASVLAATSAQSGDPHPGPALGPPATQSPSSSADETDDRGDGEDQGIPTPPAEFVEPPLRHVPIIFRSDPAAVEIPHVEARFLQLLRPLIDTPRAAKKLANMYRIVRASARGTRLDRLVGTDDEPGEHRAVALLLAIIVGRPLRSAAFCGAIETAPRPQTWPVFLISLQPVRDPSRGGIWVHKGAQQLAPLDVKAWRSLLEDIDEIATAAAKAQLDLPATMGTYQDWLFETARFSFQTARLVTQRHTGPQRGL
jgi:KAP family P-loop domain/WD domain, G-beta repeat